MNGIRWARREARTRSLAVLVTFTSSLLRVKAAAVQIMFVASCWRRARQGTRVVSGGGQTSVLRKRYVIFIYAAIRLSETESMQILSLQSNLQQVCGLSTGRRLVAVTSEQPPPPAQPTASTRHDSCTSAAHRRAADAADPRSSPHAPSCSALLLPLTSVWMLCRQATHRSQPDQRPRSALQFRNSSPLSVTRIVHCNRTLLTHLVF